MALGLTLFIGCSVFVIGITALRLLFFPYKGWMALGHALRWINSHIILAHYYRHQPIAFFMRLTGYDPLRRRKGENTYRENRKTIPLTPAIGNMEAFIDLSKTFRLYEGP